MPASHTIIIPTCKSREDVQPVVDEVHRTATGEYDVVATCATACASVNRNLGLDACRHEYAIMMDDDITRMPRGWNEALVQVLVEQPDVVMVSARLLTPDGRPGQMLGVEANQDSGVQDIPRRELPTACIAIRNDGLRFDEEYVGSGFEDTDFSAALRFMYLDGRWVVQNDVRVVHLNEQKNQGPHFHTNKARYEAKWGATIGNYG